jgi:hypothetical protein
VACLFVFGRLRQRGFYFGACFNSVCSRLDCYSGLVARLMDRYAVRSPMDVLANPLCAVEFYEAGAQSIDRSDVKISDHQKR